MDYQLIEALSDPQKFKQLRDEWGTIRALLVEVQTRTGFKRKVEVALPSFHLREFAKGPTLAATTHDGTIPPEITYTPGITEFLNPYMLAGVIAHELGHIERGDTENMSAPDRDMRQIEYDADMWATERGFGLNLIAGFQRMEEFVPERYWRKANDSHPGLQDRIDAIQNYLNQTERKAA